MRFYIYVICWIFCIKGVSLLDSLAKDDVFKWPVHILDESINFLLLLKIIMIIIGVLRGVAWFTDRAMNPPVVFKGFYLGSMVVILALALLIIGSIFLSVNFDFLSINNYRLLYLIVVFFCIIFIVLELIDHRSRFVLLHNRFNEIKMTTIKIICKKLIKKAQSSIGLVYRDLKPDSKGMVSADDLMAQPWNFECFFTEEFDQMKNKLDMNYIIIRKNKYELFIYSSDSREPGNIKSFASFVDLARYCASLQMNAAVRIALLANPRYKNLASGKTFEELQEKAYLLMDYQDMLKDRLNRFLLTNKVKVINWFTSVLINQLG